MAFYVFSPANLMEPTGYVGTGGHVPFDVRVLGFGAHWYDASGRGRSNSVTLTAGGADILPTLSLSNFGRGSVLFDTPPVIPKASDANVDTDGLFGSVTMVTDDDALMLAVLCEAVNDADAAKCIGGLGASGLSPLINPLAAPDSVGYFSGLHPNAYGDLGWNAPTTSKIFSTPHELARPSPDPDPADAYGVACTPSAAGLYSDFMLVCHDGAPGGVYQFDFRVNGVTAVSLITAATSQRVWFPTGATSVAVNEGDLVSWQLSAAAGSLNGELLWAFTPSDVVLGPGAGAGAGVSIP